MTTTKHTDVAIVGGGLAGSLCAGMLEEQGIPHILIDPREEYPDEFRCEKFNHQQIELLKETGLADKVLEELTPVQDVWMARFGKLIRKQHYPHFGFSYREAVNAVRQHYVKPASFHLDSVKSIDAEDSKQVITLSDDSTIEAKLTVLATGANTHLQNELGMEQEMLSKRHCLAIGFDLEPETDFEFDTMTYWPEKKSGKMSYLTFFRTSDGWRANLFGYWDLKDKAISDLKSAPETCLSEIMPNLKTVIGEFSVTGKLRVRPINLYQWKSSGLGGIVSIGDAWSSSCPGAGTGTTKAMSDALVLSKTYIPGWISNETTTAQDIAAFYTDPKKLAIDRSSIDEAYKLRSLTLNKTPYWQLQRWLRYAYHSARGGLSRAPRLIQKDA